MKSTGIVRQVDDLGRIVLPKELRNTLSIEIKTPLEIFTDDEYIILKKYTDSDVFTGSTSNLFDYRGKKVSVDTVKELLKLAGISASR